jgi:hypothetical protein
MKNVNNKCPPTHDEKKDFSINLQPHIDEMNLKKRCHPEEISLSCSSNMKKQDKRRRTAEPLSPEDINQFIQDGFVLLKNAFSKEIARECREFMWQRLEKDGIQKEDPSTWVERHGIAGRLYLSLNFVICNSAMRDRNLR